ncbi:MAG: uracil-DNA glycosylase [Gammaproteobacteria bacterium]|nr:uracil-DNA glycosylase [Gammaproteobacteria bacterium]
MPYSNFKALKTLGIETWQLRTPYSPASICQPKNDWEHLRSAIQSCTACGLSRTRTQTVFGVGSEQASLMIVGEAPGFYEDQQGEPFVGRAGKLLDAMLNAIGLSREAVFIANILKCRPPNNRDPLPEEVNLCTPFLEQQIRFINPKLLVAVGRIAAHFLLNVKSPLGSLRQKMHQYAPTNTPLLVTYHPAYLLRNPADKRRAWTDLQLIQRTLLSIQ